MRSGVIWVQVGLACLGGLALQTVPGRAAELDGSIFLSGGTSDSDGTESDILDQRYRLTLRQSLTEYLTMRLGYRRFDFSSETAGTDFGRRSDEPELELIYSRPGLFGSLTVLDRSSRGSSFSDELDTRSVLGHLSWNATSRLELSARFREESNTTEAVVFGRNTEIRFLDVGGNYRRRHWSTAYSFERYEIENTATGLESVQDRHEVRLDGARRFLDGRLSLGFSGELTEIDRSEEVRSGTGLAEPIPARAGLFAIDPSPEVGALEPVPGLADGDFETPVTPEIQIGDAFSFRNLGVELGATRPVTQIEVGVDAPSDPGLVWQAWHSADNLLWEPIAGVVTVWDGGLLRYTVRFPETTDRFFKVVNVTINAASDVAVTELRALRDVLEAGLTERGESTLVRADVSAGFVPHERVSANVSAGILQDEGLRTGALRRDFEDIHYSGLVTIDLPRHLQARASYRYFDAENRIEPVLVRKEALTSAALAWEPLPALEATLSYSLREEEDEARPIRTTESQRLFVSAELLPGLELDSSLEWTELEDPLGDRDRTVFAWRERLEARPTLAWTVIGGFSVVSYEDVAGERILDRNSLDLRATWRAAPFLVLTGDWSYNTDRFRDTETRNSLRQSYSVSYSPGSKLNLTGSYQEFDDERFRETVTVSAGFSYRLHPRFRLFGNLTRSETTLGVADTTEISSFRTGLSVFF